MTRLLPLLIAAVALAGCGSSVTDAVAPAAPAVAAKPKHVRTLPKKVFVRHANAVCRRLADVDVAAMPTITSDVARNRRVLGAWFGRAHRELRRGRRELVRLGQPSRDRARWRRVMAKFRAVERHIDTLRAAAWAGSVPMYTLAVREGLRSDQSLDRRFRRFGAKACGDF